MGIVIVAQLFVSVLTVLFILAQDREEPEPVAKVLLLFALAVGCTALYGQWVVPLLPDGNDQSFSYQLIRAALPEEALKFALFGVVVWRWRTVDEPYDAIVYLAIIAIGFSIDENAGYVFSDAIKHGILPNDAMQRRFVAAESGMFAARMVPGHLIFDVIAASIATSRGVHKLKVMLPLGFATAVLLHASYNTIALSPELNVAFPLYVVILTILATSAVMGHRPRSPFAARREAALDVAAKNLFLLSHQDIDPAETHLHEEALALIREIQASLRDLPSRPSREQQEIVVAFQNFPAPVSDWALPGPHGLVARLQSVRSGVVRQTAARLDWVHFAWLAFGLYATGFVAFVVSWRLTF